MSPEFDSAIIVGEDVDLLVLLTALGAACQNVYFLKPGKGKILQRLYSSHSLSHGKIVTDNILFLHAFSGCDTTSALFNQGKVKFLTILKKHKNLQEVIQVFQDSNAEADTIADAGERFLLALYGANHEDNISLDAYRYQCFVRSLTKSKFNIASLPPTVAAARQHSFRTYYQVQQWQGVKENVEKWGWKQGKTGLTPVTTLKDPAPEKLLKFISCKCKKGCTAACGCRKVGLQCSVICAFCNGQNCENAPAVDELDDEEVDSPVETLLINIEYNQRVSVDGETEGNSDESVAEDYNEPGPSTSTI